LADCVDYLDPHHWDSVTADQTVFLRRAVLRVIEEHGPENVQPRYAMIFRDRRPVAMLAAQVVSVTGDRLSREKPPSDRSRPSPLLQRVLAPAGRKVTGG